MPWTHISTHATGYLYTATDLNNAWNNLSYLERVNITTFIADVTINATTVGTANQVVSAGAITYEAVPHLIEFYAPRYTGPANATNVILRDGTTVLGTVANVAASTNVNPFYFGLEITPTAGSHTYNIAAWLAGAGSGTMRAGNGGAAGDATTFMPGFIRITRIPT